MFDPLTAGIVVGGSALGGVLGLWGANKQADAATQAAQIQADAAKQASELQWKQFLIAKEESEPWRTSGKSALAKLNDYLGTVSAPTDFGTMPSAPDQKDFKKRIAVGSPYGKGTGYLMIPDTEAYNAANEKYQKDLLAYNSNKQSKMDAYAKETQDPTYGVLLKQFDFSNPEAADPGYSFRLKQGLNALGASAAARGGYFSGQTGNDLMNYGQDYASGEYASAYNRDMQNKINIYNMLAQQSGLGESSAASLGSMGMNTATNVGNLSMAGANAIGAGQTGAASAYNQGLMNLNNNIMSGVGNLAQYAMYSNLKK
jgi:hypothetical protein